MAKVRVRVLVYKTTWTMKKKFIEEQITEILKKGQGKVLEEE